MMPKASTSLGFSCSSWSTTLSNVQVSLKLSERAGVVELNREERKKGVMLNDGLFLLSDSRETDGRA